MKKILSIVVALAMVFAMAMPTFATQIGTVVPAEHNVTVNYNEGGYVFVNGKVVADGAQFKVNRFGEIDLSVLLQNGYHLESITVNGVDVTADYIDGNYKLKDIVTDTNVNVTFAKCADDPDDTCKKADMQGNVYLGEEKLVGAELDFDFGSATATTNKDGRYEIKDIQEGKHFVTISKDGEVLSNTSFVIEFTEQVDEVTLTTNDGGVTVVLVPEDAKVIYLDFHIVDKDNNGIPDQDPDKTDPGDPENPKPFDPDGEPEDVYDDPDDDNDGIPDEQDPDHPNRDTDDDGTPDKDDDDDDNDGIPDVDDDDDDGDGVPDKDDPDHPDRDTDGDGTPDKDDDDDDNDGVPDVDDDDDDGDGVPDKDDPEHPDRDTDGDGIPDREDDDDDNDGIPDAEDPDKDGDGHIDDYDGGDDDQDDDGVIITIGEPEKVVGGDIPDTLAELFQNPVAVYSVMAISLFLFFIILFKRKKDDEEEDEAVA